MSAPRGNAYIRHGPRCPDGTWAAMPFWLALPPSDRVRLEELLGEGADFNYKAAKAADPKWRPDHKTAAAEGLPLFLHANPGDYPPQDLLEGYHVFLLDFCYAADALEALVKEVGPQGRITILDHHATNERTVTEASQAHPDLIEAVFDMSRSGAEIAWDYARTHDIYIGPESLIMRYVGDRDTWRWSLPKSKEVNAAFRIANTSASLGRAAVAYAAEINAGQQQAIEDYALAGAHYLEAQMEIVNTMAHAAKIAYVTTRDPDTGTLTEHRIRVVNCPTLQSEIGHVAASIEIEDGVLPDFAAVWYYTHAADEVRISLRRGHPAVDMSKIAPTIVGVLSGGGHAAAAGCVVKGSDVKSIFRTHSNQRPDSKPAEAETKAKTDDA